MADQLPETGDTRRPRLLDLFCCAGGASMGYHRAGQRRPSRTGRTGARGRIDSRRSGGGGGMTGISLPPGQDGA